MKSHGKKGGLFYFTQRQMHFQFPTVKIQTHGCGRINRTLMHFWWFWFLDCSIWHQACAVAQLFISAPQGQGYLGTHIYFHQNQYSVKNKPKNIWCFPPYQCNLDNSTSNEREENIWSKEHQYCKYGQKNVWFLVTINFRKE